ncbi:N-acetylmuramoyl-L-alanine amidase-like domain-containing protein [uncultured Croceitalea sp.]|uniref:N-acetylmuramoyl-L-alanine amidase-like domain-containing protein n=1 Tax=uncultured Croceitalea sp. TaxID=1798908 RepID=UPI0033061886
MKHGFIALFAFFFSVNVLAQSVTEPEDKTIFAHKIKAFYSHESLLNENQIVHIGKSFLGTPYVEKTLEIGETESVVINLRGLDCTTFVENVIAFSMLLQDEKSDFEEFVNSIETIRYKNGAVDGYASRLHYFTDWIRTNEQKGLVKDITAELGGTSVEKPINFMGTHRDLYPFLKNEANYNRILETEAELATKEFCYLPQADIRQQEANIESGDIIALATAIEGLDVTHTGIAIRQPNGRIHLLHASISGEVKITEEPLVDYLKKVKRNIGIIVARPTL